MLDNGLYSIADQIDALRHTIHTPSMLNLQVLKPCLNPQDMHSSKIAFSMC